MRNISDQTSIVQGSARDERLLKALLPEHARLDGRDVPEWLAFLARAAGMIRYVNPDNEFSGHWDAFLKNDPSVFLALLMEEKPEVWDAYFRAGLRKYYNAWGEEGKQQAYAEILALTLSIARGLDYYYKGAEALSDLIEEHPVKAFLQNAIEHDLGEAMQKYRVIIGSLKRLETELLQTQLDQFHTRYNELNASVQSAGAIQTLLQEFHPIWGLHYENTSFEVKDRDTMVDRLRRMFHQFHFMLVYLAEKTPEWFRLSLEHKHDHKPYAGLLLAFLQLFRHVRDQLNTLTEQHLHHYYFDLLEQQPRGPVPDRAIVCIQLADHIDKYWLEKQTQLLAAVNDQGVASLYATETVLPLTQAKLIETKTLFVGRNEAAGVESSFSLITGLYVAPVANSRNGLGLPLSAEDPSWPVFGEDQIGKNPGERRMVDAMLGFAIAAPILTLQEGQREVDLRFQFTESAMSWLITLLEDIRYHSGLPTDVWVRRIFGDAFTVLASGAEGWFPIRHLQFDSSEGWMQNRGITMTLFLTEEDPAVVHAAPEILGEDYETPWPVVKIMIHQDHAIYPYSFVSALELESLAIAVRVKGLRSLSVYNELGLLDISAPFLPFGPMPRRNTAFMVGHPEFLGKKLVDLSFYLEWAHLPEAAGGFAEHYQGYAQPADNTQFKVRISALSNARFWPHAAEHQQELPLFASDAPKGPLHAAAVLDHIDLSRLQIQTDYLARTLPEFTNKTRSGYFKFQLTQPAMAFGHAEYPRLFAQALIAQSKPAGLLRFSERQEIPLPKEPYVPVLNQITAAYQAGTVLNVKPMESANNDVAAGEKIFCLHPFGRQLIFSDGRAADRYLFPRYDAGGYLFLGFAGVEANTPLSLLFHLRESHSKNRGDTLSLRWEYLHANRWESLTQEHLMTDGTQGFTTTGIVRLVTPPEVDLNNTIMPSGLFWLRVAAKGDLEKAGRALGIMMNAVEVVWIDNGDSTHFAADVPLPHIKELAIPCAEIASITQPVDFYGGKAGETLAEFYVRVSERLHHKNRGVTSWDIEHLILGQFPFLREAKCITPNAHKSIEPGSMLAVVVPSAPETTWEPSLGGNQLEQIRLFLQKRSSAFATVKVINPDYEKIKITCAIQLKEGFRQEEGLYARYLHEELLYFICPWLQKGHVAFGAGLRRNDVLAFIKSRPYVQFVTQLSLVKIFEPVSRQHALQDTAQRTEPLEVLYPENPWSVFVPVNQHNLSFLTAEKIMLPEATAIEAMRLGTDFIVAGNPEAPFFSPEVEVPATHPDAEDPDDDDNWFLIKE